MKSKIKIVTLFAALLVALSVRAEYKIDIEKPANTGGAVVPMTYTQIYDFIEELAEMRIIRVASVCKPYDRKQVARWLFEAAEADSLLSKRQRDELKFYINDFALELDSVPAGIVCWTDKKKFALSLLQPAFHYNDKYFKCKINPIIGGDFKINATIGEGDKNIFSRGTLMHRYWGAEIRMDIVNHIAVWGSVRDHSYSNQFVDTAYFKSINHPLIEAARTQQSRFFNMEPGGGWHYAKYGYDYAELTGGVRAYDWWGSIGIVKEKVRWGDSYYSSNILCDRAPSFPMVEIKLHPCKWFQLNYLHGYLMSGVVDSTFYYEKKSSGKKVYRPAPKYIAANMLTFTPIKGLDLSIGSSVVYSERNWKLMFGLPVTFFDSGDYQLSAGSGLDNDNCQIFANISTRNLKYTHFFVSLFADEIKWERFVRKDINNFVGFKVGANVTNWPVKDLYFGGEFTRTYPQTYQHDDITNFTSNGYSLGHYLGSNSQEIFVQAGYRPVRGLNINLHYINATKYNDYEYKYVAKVNPDDNTNVTGQPPFRDVIWRMHELKLHALYEVVNNIYVYLDFAWARHIGYDKTTPNTPLEVSKPTAAENLKAYSPVFYWGETLTTTLGLSIYF